MNKVFFGECRESMRQMAKDGIISLILAESLLQPLLLQIVYSIDIYYSLGFVHPLPRVDPGRCTLWKH